MKTKIFMGSVGLLLAASLTIGETVTASSSAFSFPAVVETVNGKTVARAAFFTSQNLGAQGTIKLAWAVPNQMASAGSIAIYSLSGKVVADFSVTEKIGSLTWNATDAGVANGVYMARIDFGKYSQKLKMVLFN